MLRALTRDPVVRGGAGAGYAAALPLIVSRVSGREIAYEQTPLEQVRAWSEDFAITYEWFDRVGYSADIQRLRQDYPEVGWQRFEEWAAKRSWSVLEATPARG